MGEHSKKKKGKHEDGKPRPRSGKDLCAEFGHSSYVRYGQPYLMGSKWFVFARCERCEAEWEEETRPPAGRG